MEELKAFYDSHQKSYANSIPEKRKIKYVVLDTAKVQAGVQVTHDDLQAYYNQHRDQYRVPEQIKVSHIWIKMPLPGPDGKIDEKGVAEAQRRADDLLKQLKARSEVRRRGQEIFGRYGKRQRGRVAGLDWQEPDGRGV